MTMLQTGQEKPVFETMTSVVEPVESRTYEDLVKAQNKALEKLSREIAGAIQQASAVRWHSGFENQAMLNPPCMERKGE
jgi:hypothetical protein